MNGLYFRSELTNQWRWILLYAIVWLIGGYAALFGVLLIFLGVQFRRITKTQFA
jgi:hypothetical protein